MTNTNTDVLDREVMEGIIATSVRLFTKAMAAASTNLMLKMRNAYQLGFDPQMEVFIAANEQAKIESYIKAMTQRLEVALDQAIMSADYESVDLRKVSWEKAIQRERTYVTAHIDAVARRLERAHELGAVHRESPAGALWVLGKNVKRHTPDCAAMGGKAWSWPVLLTVNPYTRHYGCQCHIEPLPADFDTSLINSYIPVEVILEVQEASTYTLAKKAFSAFAHGAKRAEYSASAKLKTAQRQARQDANLGGHFVSFGGRTIFISVNKKGGGSSSKIKRVVNKSIAKNTINVSRQTVAAPLRGTTGTRVNLRKPGKTPTIQPLSSVRDYPGEVGNDQHLTRIETGNIPLKSIANLIGARGEKPGEHRNKMGKDWAEFVADIKANGVKEPIFITVDYNDNPKISEGNHRRDAAIEAGLDSVPVEIKYYGRSEQQGSVTNRGTTPIIPAKIKDDADITYSEVMSIGSDTMLDEDTIRAAYSGKFITPLGEINSVVNKITVTPGDNNMHTIEGTFIDSKYGSLVGHYRNYIYRDNDGRLVANHDNISLDDDIQGQGLVERFNRRKEMFYRVKGVEEIRLYANVDVGGYAWARSGYNFGPNDSAKEILRITKDGEWEEDDNGNKFNRRTLYMDSMAEIEDNIHPEEYYSYEDAINSGEIQHPYQLSQLGKEGTHWKFRGHDMWYGKALMMGSYWDGVKQIRPLDDNELSTMEALTENAPEVLSDFAIELLLSSQGRGDMDEYQLGRILAEVHYLWTLRVEGRKDNFSSAYAEKFVSNVPGKNSVYNQHDLDISANREDDDKFWEAVDKAISDFDLLLQASVPTEGASEGV